MTLKNRVAAFSLLLLVPAIFLLTFLSNYQLKSDMQAVLMGQQKGIVKVAAEGIAEHLRDSKQLLLDFSAHLPSNILKNPALFKSFVYKQELLENTFSETMLLVNREGLVIADADRLRNRKGLLVSDRDYFKILMETGQPVLSDVLAAKDTGMPILVIAVPIKNAEGHIEGAVLGGINLTRTNLVGALATTQLGSSGFFYIYSSLNQKIVSHPDADQVLRPLAQIRFQGKSLQSSIQIPDSPFILVAHLPEEEAYSPIQRTVYSIQFYGVFIAFSLAILLWGVVNQILKPLEKMRLELEKMDVRDKALSFLSNNTNDELGLFARAFNQLVNTVAQKQADLESSETRWKFALESHGDGVIDWYPNEGHAAISPHIADMLGYAPESFKFDFEHWEHAIHVEDRERVLSQLEEHLLGRTPFYHTTYRIKGADGRYRWLLDRGKVIERDENGKAQRVILTRSNIDSLKEAERALRESQRKLLHLTDTIPGMVFQYQVSASEGSVGTFCSRGGVALLGISEPELLEYAHPQGLLQCVELSDRAFFESTFQAALADRNAWHLDLRLRSPLGLVKWVHIHVIPEWGGAYEEQVWNGIVIDITDRKRAEAQLEEDQTRLTLAIEASGAALYEHSADFSTGRISPRWAELFGYDLNALPDSNQLFEWWRSQIHPDYVETFLKCYLSFLMADAQEARFEYEYQAKHLSGEWIWIRQMSKKLFDSNKNLSAIVGVILDITAEKESLHQMTALATLDYLTGLGNRYAFHQFLEAQLAQQVPFGLFFIDLDGFKKINDVYGHEAGDAILKQVAQQIRSLLFPREHVFRLGGDEFTVLFLLEDRLDAKAFGQTLIDAIVQKIEWESNWIGVGASVGGVLVEHEAMRLNAETLLNRSDEAMYAVKQNGKGAVILWNELHNETIS